MGNISFLRNFLGKFMLPTPEEDYIKKFGRGFYERVSDQRLTYVDKVLVQVITASNFIKLLKYNYNMFDNTTILSAGVKPEVLRSSEIIRRETCAFQATQKIVGQLYEVALRLDSSNFDISRPVKEDVLTIYAVRDKADPLVLASYFWKINEEKLRQLLYIIPGISDVTFSLSEEMLFSCKITNRDTVAHLLVCIFFILDQLDKDYRILAAKNKRRKLFSETFYDLQPEE